MGQSNNSLIGFINKKEHLPIARLRSLLNTKPTKYCDSLETTTGYPLCSVSFNNCSTSSTVIESCVITLSVSFRLETKKKGILR